MVDMHSVLLKHYNNKIMKKIIKKENLTNSERIENPINLDIMRYHYSDGCIIEKQIHINTEQDSSEAVAKHWRDNELQSTDYIVPITDHPSHTAFMSYREELRDWPSTDAFPDTKPIKP
jgi:hypothetical protein